MGYLAYLLFKNQIGQRIMPNPFELTARNVRFSFSTTGIQANILVDVTNKTPVAGSMDGFTGQVVFESASGPKVLAQINNVGQVTIAAGKTAQLTIPAMMPYTQLAQGIIAIIEQQDFQGRLKLKGLIRTGSVGIPVNETLA